MLELRRTLALLGPEDAAALLVDLEAGNGAEKEEK